MVLTSDKRSDTPLGQRLQGSAGHDNVVQQRHGMTDDRNRIRRKRQKRA